MIEPTAVFSAATVANGSSVFNLSALGMHVLPVFPEHAAVGLRSTISVLKFVSQCHNGEVFGMSEF